MVSIKKPKYKLKYILSRVNEDTRAMFDFVMKQLSRELIYSKYPDLGLEGSEEYFEKLFDQGIVIVDLSNKLNEIGKNCLDVKVWYYDYSESDYIPVQIEGFEYLQEE